MHLATAQPQRYQQTGPMQRPQAPAQRIDPAAIPRPKYTSSLKPHRYQTSGAAQNIAPPGWADFVAEDTGSASPRVMRASLAHVPTSRDLLRDSHMPLAAMVVPLGAPNVAAGERPVALVDMGADGPIR